MPIRQGCILASRASTWPRDHFCRSTMAPRAWWPTTWNEFLPISMPITAIAVLGVWDMACSLSLVPLAQLRLLAGQEHGRTIPLADVRRLFTQAPSTIRLVPHPTATCIGCPAPTGIATGKGWLWRNEPKGDQTRAMTISAVADGC